jgi:phospholipase C
LWGRKYLPISFKLSQFLDDCATNHLPAVSFVDPRFIGELDGVSNDDHPHADIRNGQAFLNQIYTAVTTSPAWPKTVLVINYDEWGGFFEHVPPPTAPLPRADRMAGSDGRIGFRVPNLVVSPWSRRGFVSNTQFDHTSVLKMIEWRWGLNPLTVRDFTANNLAEALDFSQFSLAAPQFSVPTGPFGGNCGEGFTPANADDWFALKSVARQNGWGV